MEVIGEAAARVSGPVQEANPHVAWGQIVALRNRLIHGYDSVDFNILWTIIQDDLPMLAEHVRRMLAQCS